MRPEGVSVVVAAYNEEDYLPRLVPNLRARLSELPDGIPVEVLVSDGGSTDRTHNIVESADIFDRLIINNDGGVLDGRRNGIEAAEYDLQAHIDADTIYRPEWLPNLLKPFSQDGDVVLTYGPVRGEGFEMGLRELYALGLRKIKGSYAPGQNRALWRPAYQRCPYRDVEQDVAVVTSMEEEVEWPSRMQEQGKTIYVRSASCQTSGRQTGAMLGAGEKSGGVEWKLDAERITEGVGAQR
jgi:glycosyltransferase involved in cell wall biosynthesis